MGLTSSGAHRHDCVSVLPRPPGAAEDAYGEADAHLTFAFENCHRDARDNKRLILQYLVPIKLVRLRFPSKEPRSV